MSRSALTKPGEKISEILWLFVKLAIKLQIFEKCLPVFSLVWSDI